MPIKVELFTSNYCAHCEKARKALESAVAELGPEHFELCVLDVVEQIDHAVDVGVLRTPAITIDGKLIRSIRINSVAMKSLLYEHLAEPGGMQNA